MKSKKVLIITYYWPPSAGSGVQRRLKFAKYLPQFGWSPYVFTPENPSFPIRDESLVKNQSADIHVTRIPIWEPYDLFTKLSGILGGKKITKPTDFISTGKKGFFQKFSSWVRGNIFIPDPKMFWIRPAVRFLSSFLKKHDIDIIITTGPPHSINLIGYHLKKKNPQLKWVADLRDPWSEWDLLDTLHLTKAARRLHQKLERNVLQAADRVVTISAYHAKRFGELGGRKVDLITNGFDEDDFNGLKHVRTSTFTIRHIGTVDELRDPRPFMEAMEEIAREDSSFAGNVTVEFIGHVNSAFIRWIGDNDVLNKFTFFKSHINHDQLMSVYGATDVLLLVLANTVLAPGNLPGKFFEYLASAHPIIAIGPTDGDAGNVIRQSDTGAIIERTDGASMKKYILMYYNKWLNNESLLTAGAAQFSRKALTQQLSDLLNTL